MIKVFFDLVEINEIIRATICDTQNTVSYNLIIIPNLMKNENNNINNDNNFGNSRAA